MDIMLRFPNTSTALQVVGCHFSTKPGGWTYREHHHHLYELFYCMEGQVQICVNPAVVKLQQGDWLLIKTGAKHSLHNDTDHMFSYFNFHFDIDDQDVRKRLSSAPFQYFPASLTMQSPLLGRIRELEQLMRSNAQTSGTMQNLPEQLVSLSAEENLAVQGTSLLIIYDILRLLRMQEAGGSASAHASAAPYISAFAADMANAIEAKLAQQQYAEASIADVAHSLNLSLSQCSKIFQRVYGISPRHYVSRLKLIKAKQLLSTTTMTINDIAETLGFQSASHFSRQFRRWTGQSPLQFRGAAATTKEMQTE
ncbi:helix-turn-helix domain-containing protein [Paenibacillus sp. GCM10027626]|uniref:helix-turn-helix domain-containing protein n=1 Tax=Paenibacillus sp. GCM10027626 TaxID=3273411 RepID=UPI00364094B9